ncbi:MAG TPA: AzlD domain-containing protein [Dehalococcoidia bacterium]|nr:AzlD domain-containing protein [Dehalococcoidia bacterium]
MSTVWITLIVAVALYALRLSGFVLPEAALPRGTESALRFVPVATLTALIVSGLAARPEESTPRLLALGVAAAIAWRSGVAWLCLGCGMGVYWLARLL